MPRTDVVVEIDTPNSFRVAQVAGMFDVSLETKVRRSWSVDLPLDDRSWSIGLIVGPSGCGKSTVARALWPANYVHGFDWTDASILDNFPASMNGKEIVASLTAVGFSSPPDWVKPYHVLSTGQQMRADLARALCADGLVVFDEFTSVVDRTVAQIGSAALAKTVRKQEGRQFIAVTCHADVLEWLAPDWTYEPHTNTFAWRSLQRPQIDLDIFRVDSAAWPLFAPYHYLSADLHGAAECYVAEWRGVSVGFVAVLPVIGFRNARRESRIVILPDYQGVGIGSRLSTAIAQIYRERGMRYRSTTSHPGFIAHRNRSTDWTIAAQAKGTQGKHRGICVRGKNGHSYDAVTSTGRRVITWEYVGA